MYILKKLRSLIFNNWLILLLLLATVLTELYFIQNFISDDGRLITLGLLDENYIFRFIPITALVFAVMFKDTDHYRVSRFLISTIVPFFAILFLWIFVTDNRLADIIAREDGLIENVSALMLFISSALAISTGIVLCRMKLALPGILTILGALLLAVIGMEEISWMQRIFNIDTPAALMENNMQQEINFHNLNTLLFETIYYFGAFVLLTVLPFYEKKLSTLLNKKKITKNIAVLIPGFWLLTPFAIIAGFTKGGEYYTNPVIALTIAGTFAVLAYLIYKSIIKKSFVSAIMPSISMIILTLSLIVFTFHDYSAWGTRPNFPTEYKEAFIAAGLMAYVISIRFKALARSN